MAGLNYLLELDRATFVFERGFWVRIRTWRVMKSRAMPHGIRYSLSLHDKNGRRLLGFDNAHAPLAGRGGSGRSSEVYDHVHYSPGHASKSKAKSAKESDTKPYRFVSAEQLLIDFFTAVERELNSH